MFAIDINITTFSILLESILNQKLLFDETALKMKLKIWLKICFFLSLISTTHFYQKYISKYTFTIFSMIQFNYLSSFFQVILILRFFENKMCHASHICFIGDVVLLTIHDILEDDQVSRKVEPPKTWFCQWHTRIWLINVSHVLLSCAYWEYRVEEICTKNWH